MPHLTVDSWVQSQVISCGICSQKNGVVQAFSQVLWLFLSVSFHQCSIFIFHSFATHGMWS